MTTAWTSKHDAFCLENRVTPSAKLLWHWLEALAKGNHDQELEPDLKDFNKWVEKHRGKGFCRLTLKNALAQLIDLRVVDLIKQFTWSIVRIATRPLEWLKPKKNLRQRNKNYAQQPSNQQNTDDAQYSSSNYSLSEEELAEHEAVLTECENAGIVFDPIQSPEILDYTHEEVKAAIKLFHQRGGHKKIKNPQGWLIGCLRRRWYEQPQGWSFIDLLTALGVIRPEPE
ncbi:MAG TPA: hypothetical protein VK203_07840 [Nostocaceae cyanobacterium]|nr:hypothetical protein [Nostocaceae cyanobacterium]